MPLSLQSTSLNVVKVFARLQLLNKLKLINIYTFLSIAARKSPSRKSNDDKESSLKEKLCHQSIHIEIVQHVNCLPLAEKAVHR